MYTNRILATSGIVLVLLTAGVVVAIRVFAAPAREGGDGPDVDRRIEVARFAAIELRGGWDLHLRHASEYSAVLTGDRELVDTAEVSTAGERLSIHLQGDSDEDRTVRIVITAPAVEALSLAGAVNGTIAGLDAAELTVLSEGATNLVFEDSTIGELTLQTAGAANIDLGESLVENAVLSLTGANQLRITMNGGSLTGRVEGVGNVRYSGETSSVNVDTEGIVRLRRR